MNTVNVKQIDEIKNYLEKLNVKELTYSIASLENEYDNKVNEIEAHYNNQVTQVEMQMSMEVNNISMQHDSIIAQYKNYELQAESEWKRIRQLRGETANNVATELFHEIGIGKKVENSSSWGGNPPLKNYEKAKSQRKRAEKDKKNSLSKMENSYKKNISNIKKDLRNQISELGNSYEDNFFHLISLNKIEIENNLKELLLLTIEKENKYSLIFKTLNDINIAQRLELIDNNQLNKVIEEVLNINELEFIVKEYIDIYESNRVLMEEIKTNDKLINIEIKDELNSINDILKNNFEYTKLDLHIDLNNKEQLAKNKKDFNLLKNLSNSIESITESIESALYKFNRLSEKKEINILDLSFTKSEEIKNNYENLKENEIINIYEEFISNKSINLELKEFVIKIFDKSGFKKISDFNNNKYFVNEIEEYSYLNQFNFVKNNINNFDQFLISTKNIDLNNFKKDISTLNKKIWIKRFFIFLLIVFIPVGFFLYNSNLENMKLFSLNKLINENNNEESKQSSNEIDLIQNKKDNDNKITEEKIIKIKEVAQNILNKKSFDSQYKDIINNSDASINLATRNEESKQSSNEIDLIQNKKNNDNKITEVKVIKIKEVAQNLLNKKSFDSQYNDIISNSDAFKKSEKELNKTYKQVRANMTEEEKKELLWTQRKWLKLRNKNAQNSANQDWQAFEKSIVEFNNKRIQELLNN